MNFVFYLLLDCQFVLIVKLVKRSKKYQSIKDTMLHFRVPTAQVYPQFMHLATIWFGFQDEMVLLSVLSNICK